MRVTALGTADGFNSAGRGHTAWLVEDAHGLYAVDFGATALLSMKRLGCDPLRLSAVHFTHLHGDHFAGWPFLLLDALHRGKRTRRLVVSGPPGTRERLQALWALCYPDTAKKPLSFEVQVHELKPGETAALAGRTVRAFAARHQRAPHVALSLRIDDLAFTGDTGAHAGLAELARGAQLLCAECTELSRPAGPEAPRHLSWEELRELLPALGVPRVLLAHLGEGPRAARGRIEEEARALGLDVRLCDDLDGFDLA